MSYLLKNFAIKIMNLRSEKITKISSALEQELQVAILKKAILFEREFNKNKKKYTRPELK